MTAILVVHCLQEIDDDNDDDEEGLESSSTGIHAETLASTGSTQAAVQEGEKTGLSPHDIGAHWLQRELNKFYNDPIQVTLYTLLLKFYYQTIINSNGF